MPYLLLLISLMLVSCKKENLHKTNPVIMPAEQRSYLSHSHEIGDSQFRNKLLNQLVEQKFPTDKTDSVVKNYDELEGMNLTKDDLKTYMEKERLMAKLVVSYTDRLDVYFLPRGVALSNIASQLGLKAEAGRVLKWMSTADKTVEGQSLYLINVNHEDLMENDKKVYQEVYNYQDFNEKKGFVLADGREAEISLKHLFYKEQVVSQEFNGRVVKCTRDLMEAGMCGQCKYKRHIPSGSFGHVEDVSLDEVGFRMMINGERFLTSELPNELTSDGVIRFKIRSNDFLKNKQTVLEVEKTAAPVYEQQVYGFEYNDLCLKNEGRGSISLQSKADIFLNVKILGRGEMLRAISL